MEVTVVCDLMLKNTHLLEFKKQKTTKESENHKIYVQLKNIQIETINNQTYLKPYYTNACICNIFQTYLLIIIIIARTGFQNLGMLNKTV